MRLENPILLNPSHTFSDEELGLLTDTDFFRTKQAIDSKVLEQLNTIQAHLQPKVLEMKPLWPQFVDWQRGKITRGNHYKGLPYWVLDYPSGFGSEDWCTLRTLCLWGHGYSQHILLKGQPLAQCKAHFIENQGRLESQHWKLHIDTDIWQWENREEFLAETSSYSDTAWQSQILAVNVLKLSRFWAFEQFDRLQELANEALPWMVSDSISD
jgi:hypothetical protein